MLIRWCRAENEPNLIHYPLFIEYVNWKNTAPSDKLNSTTIGSIPSLQLANKMASVTLKSPDKTTATDDKEQAVSDIVVNQAAATTKNEELIAKQPQLLVCTPGGSYRTSSQTICATIGNISNISYPTCGVPTIRSDKAAPRIKRVSDNTVS